MQHAVLATARPHPTQGLFTTTGPTATPVDLPNPSSVSHHAPKQTLVQHQTPHTPLPGRAAPDRGSSTSHTQKLAHRLGDGKQGRGRTGFLPSTQPGSCLARGHPQGLGPQTGPDTEASWEHCIPPSTKMKPTEQSANTGDCAFSHLDFSKYLPSSGLV